MTKDQKLLSLLCGSYETVHQQPRVAKFPPLTELLLFIYFQKKSSDRSSPVCWRTQAPKHPLARPQRAFASAPPLPRQFAPCRYCPLQRLGLKMERDEVCRRKWTEVSMCIATHFLIAFFKYANWAECIILCVVSWSQMCSAKFSSVVRSTPLKYQIFCEHTNSRHKTKSGRNALSCTNGAGLGRL